MQSQPTHSGSWDVSLASREERRAKVKNIGNSEFQAKLNRGNVFGNCQHSLVPVKCGCQKNFTASLCTLCMTIYCNSECLEESKMRNREQTPRNGKYFAANGVNFDETDDFFKDRAKEARKKNAEERRTKLRLIRTKRQASSNEECIATGVQETVLAIRKETRREEEPTSLKPAEPEYLAEEEPENVGDGGDEPEYLAEEEPENVGDGGDEPESTAAEPEVEQQVQSPILNEKEQGFQKAIPVAEQEIILKSLQDEEIGFNFPRIRANFPIPKEYKNHPMAWMMKLSLPQDCYFKIDITNVVDLENFYVVLECHLGQVQQIEEHISRLASFGLELPDLRNATLPKVACVQVDDHKWRRCSVLSVEEDMCKIILIDSGIHKEAKTRELRVLPSDFYYKNPYAVQCSLSVKPKKGGKWNERLNDFLRNMAKTECSSKSIDGEYLTIKCLKILETGKHVVEIGILGGEDWAGQLVESGLAVYSEEAGM